MSQNIVKLCGMKDDFKEHERLRPKQLANLKGRQNKCGDAYGVNLNFSSIHFSTEMS